MAESPFSHWRGRRIAWLLFGFRSNTTLFLRLGTPFWMVFKERHNFLRVQILKNPRGIHMAMGQNPVPPVNIPIPTTIGSKMGGEFTYQPKWDPKTVLTTAANFHRSPVTDGSPFSLRPPTEHLRRGADAADFPPIGPAPTDNPR